MKIIEIKTNEVHERAAKFAARKGGYLLQDSNSTKASKAIGTNYLNAILYLAPADQVDGINLCPMAERAGCKKACLNTAGRGAFNSTQHAREEKTKLYRDSPDLFWRLLEADIARLEKKAARKGKKLAVRINGTSDIVVEKKRPQIFAKFPGVRFYDYTKVTGRDVSHIPNYSLTLSYSEASMSYADQTLDHVQDHGNNFAAVFRGDTLPAKFRGYRVIDGDKTDLRFLDPVATKRRNPVCVGLLAKGKAKQDTSGFVVDMVAWSKPLAV